MTDSQAGSPGNSFAPRGRRAGAILAGGVAVLAMAAVALGAGPSPAAPSSSASAAFDHRGFGIENFGGRFAFGGITITAIDGSRLSLETEDGWTRTITVTDETEITKDGETIEPAGLAVGDRIRLAQSRADDGTYTIERIAIVLPHVGGEVTAVSGNAITVETPDGSSVTVHVDGETDYVVGGDDEATLSDVEVGMMVVAAGSENQDGSLDAVRVHAGEGLRGRGFRGGGFHDGMGGGAGPLWGGTDDDSDGTTSSS